MHAPSAILWQLAWPNRWGLAVMAAYLCVTIVMINAAPALAAMPVFGGDTPPIGAFVAAPCIWLGIGLLGLFTFASANARQSSLPSHMLVLPLTTRQLVAWPMAYGAAAMAAFWFIVATLVLRPLGVEGPLWWAAAPLVLAMTLTQALSWTPFAQSWLRIMLAVPLYAIPASGLAVWIYFGYSTSLLAGVFLLLLPIAYAAGVAGVARARCGEPYDWALWNRLAARINRGRERSRGPFRSAAGAQLWFECRALAWILPAFVILILFWVTSLLAMSPDDPGLTWRLLGAVILLPALVAQLMGISLAKQDIWSKYPMPAFTATRPITSLAMVRAKFGMAAVSALMCYIMLAIYLPLAFSLRPGAWQAIAQSVAATPAWKAAGIVAASFLTLVFITWTGLVSRMWLGFTGRPGLIGAYTSAVAAFWLAAVLAGSWIFYALPEWHAAIKAGVPWMIAALLLIKATAAGCVLGALHRSHVATAANIAAITVLWAAAVLLVFGIIYWLVPVEAISPLTILAAAALFIPLTRLCAAPLALAWNRHR